MTWVKLDDRLHTHPKIQRAWQACHASVGLHMLALSHAGAHHPDGHVPDYFVRMQIPASPLRRKAVGALLAAGLWEASEGGFQIHDYLDCNPVRARRSQGDSADAPPLFDHLASRGRTRERAGAPAGAGGRAQPRPHPEPEPVKTNT